MSRSQEAKLSRIAVQTIAVRNNLRKTQTQADRADNDEMERAAREVLIAVEDALSSIQWADRAIQDDAEQTFRTLESARRNLADAALDAQRGSLGISSSKLKDLARDTKRLAADVKKNGID